MSPNERKSHEGFNPLKGVFIMGWLSELIQLENKYLTQLLENRVVEYSKEKTCHAAVTIQGQTIEVKIKGGLKRPYCGGTRGDVTLFSQRSRRRLFEAFCKLDLSSIFGVCCPLFITLTYGRSYPGWEAAKLHLDTFFHVVRRRFPRSSGFWRIEDQKRGAPHFHLVFFGIPFWSVTQVKAHWARIIGWDRENEVVELPRVEVQQVRNFRCLMGYVSKYVAKQDRPDPEAARPHSADPEAGRNDGHQDLSLSECHNSSHKGRHWGVFNRKYLPVAPLKSVIDVYGRCHVKLIRAIRRYNSRVGSHKSTRFMLFTQDASKWWDLFEFYKMQEVPF